MHDDDADSSEKQFDDRASMMSVNSTKTDKDLSVNLPGIIEKMPFTKFRLGFLPFIALLAFLVTFLVSVLVIYDNSTRSIEEL